MPKISNYDMTGCAYIIIMFIIIRVVYIVAPQSVQDWLTDTRGSRATEKVSQSMSSWRGDDTMEGLSGLESASEEEGGPGSCGSGSGNNSPTLGTSFFGKHPELGKERIKKVKTKYLTFIHI